MGWFENLKVKFSKQDNYRYAQMMNGQTPVFSQFGNDVYASDIMQQCMGLICDEMSKLTINHVAVRNGQESIQNSKLNRLFDYGVNEFMTTPDFLSKITYMLLKNMNVFIYPQFSNYTDNSGKVTKREVDGLYPLDPQRVDFLQDQTGRLFTKLTFRNGSDFTLPYDSLIHWKMRFSENDYLGGDVHGEAEVDDLLKTVQVNDTLLQGVGRATEKSLNIVGIMKYPLTVDQEAIKKDIAKFEERINQSKSGILSLDAKSEYLPVKIDPKIVDKETLEFIDRKILRHWGCSLPMLNGTATPEEHQAFYQKVIEPKVISLVKAITKTVFTPLEYSNGNRIKAYPEELIFLNISEKIEFAKLMSERGALTNNQLLNIFGLPPYVGGDVRYMSLNYCDVEIANQYQLNKAGASEGGEENE